MWLQHQAESRTVSQAAPPASPLTPKRMGRGKKGGKKFPKNAPGVFLNWDNRRHNSCSAPSSDCFALAGKRHREEAGIAFVRDCIAWRKKSRHPSPLSELPCAAQWNEEEQQSTNPSQSSLGTGAWQGSPALGTTAITQTRHSPRGQQGLVATTINVRSETS